MKTTDATTTTTTITEAKSKSTTEEQQLTSSNNHTHSSSDNDEFETSKKKKSRSRLSPSKSRSKSPTTTLKSVEDSSSHSSSKNNNNIDNTTTTTTAAALALTKDQRTIFISQLVMRADERDIRKFFKKKAGCKVNDVILLRDRRTGRHKGCAYVELGRLQDVPTAILTNGTVPDFQRFPILVRASEAEKNYNDDGSVIVVSGVSGSGGASTLGSSTMDTTTLIQQQQHQQQQTPTTTTTTTKRIQAQSIYVGSIDRCVTQAQLYAIFSQFGPLESPVSLQMDPTTGISRGFAFLAFRDAKYANLAIQTMSGQKLAGRPLKTGWANHPSAPGVDSVTSDEFPDDSAVRIQNAHVVLTQLTGSGLMAMASTAQIVMAPSTSSSSSIISGGGGGGTMSTMTASSSSSFAVVPPTHIASAAEVALNMALGLPVVSSNANTNIAATTTVTTGSTVADTETANDAPTTTTVAAVAPPHPTPQAAMDTTSTATTPDTSDAKEIRGSPTLHLLVHNMFDREEETDEGWQNDIREDFEEECEKYGKLNKCIVMDKLPGGKIYASFDNVESAKNCALALAGRWFDKRQLRVEYVTEEDFQNVSC